MISNEINDIVEKISLEFVMLDFDDENEVLSILSILKKVSKAVSNYSDNTQEKVDNCIKIINNINNISPEEKAVEIDKISISITDIQQNLKKINQSQNYLYKSDDKFEEKSENILKEKVHETEQSDMGLNHPGSLPEHLDEHMFAQFLVHQGDVLPKIEELILEIENTNSPEAITQLRRSIHTLKGEAGFLNLIEVESVCHKTEDILESKDALSDIDTYLSVKDWLENTFSYYKGIGEQPANLSITKNRFEIEKKEIVNDIAIEKKNTRFEILESINVNSKRLDRMLDMIGELVIAESILSQSKEIIELNSPDLNRNISVMDKITRELQEIGLSLRMLPVKSTFQKMSRIVRDLSKKSGKDIIFSMKGEDTELDKNVVDKIGDPLLHIIRNAVDHGIESPEERTQKQKKSKAKIEMRAYQKGGNIHIEIEDDGNGIDTNKVRDHAIKNKLIHHDLILNEQELINLIFEPGFSTADKITDISGRGVGMDVVKNSIDDLKGSIAVNSILGKGCLFNISIPLTLAIIDGMVIRVGLERYIIPTLSIITSNKLENNQISTVMNKGRSINIQGELLPLFSLRDIFESESYEKSSDELVVVVEEDEYKAALIVDELIGKQQIVIKSLGEGIKNIVGISGGAIMSDGLVGLIIDVGALIKMASNR
ncbi:MAG: chemotaxis protein CheA [Desulfobacterales bacterium]|nr:chemotaxis protein CheA [Desulfobacterales bacterium]